jgi:competence protein ComEA
VPSFTLSRPQAIALTLLALAAILVAAHLLGGGGGTGASVSTVLPPLTAPAATTARSSLVGPTPGASAPRLLVVDVAGAVRHPGLYHLPSGSRIADAVARAGGMSRRAAASLVNLAAPLADGEQVLVPSLAVGAAGVAAAGGASSPSASVDLNSATVEQLDALPGIGPVTAQKIVDYRTQHGPFTSVDDLDAIPGIGPARIENLRGLVTPS